MEDKRHDIPEEEKPFVPYEPRPVWQIWMARICLVLFVALVIMYYFNIARGGM